MAACTCSAEGDDDRWLGGFKAALLLGLLPRKNTAYPFTTTARWRRREKMAKRKQLNYTSGTFLELRNYSRSVAREVVQHKKQKVQVSHSGRFDWKTMLALEMFLKTSSLRCQHLEEIGFPYSTQSVDAILSKLESCLKKQATRLFQDN